MASNKGSSRGLINADARSALSISKAILAGKFREPGSSAEDDAMMTAMTLWHASHIARRDAISAQIPNEIRPHVSVSVPYLKIDSEIGKMLFPRALKLLNERRAAKRLPALPAPKKW